MNNIEVILMKILFTHCYIILSKNTKKAIIVDPVWDAGIFARKLAGYELCAVLLTHHHFDHTNLAESMAQKYNVPIIMSHEEINHYKFNCRNLSGIGDGESLWFDDLQVTGILTPGHTMGGMCFLIDSHFFTGDTVFIEGCGYCGFDGGDPSQMFDSLQKIRELIVPSFLVYPGHSYGIAPGQSFDFVLNNNIYFNICERDKFIKFRTRKNQKELFSFK